MPKDRKKKPYSCFSRHSLVDKNRGHEVQLLNDQVHGWCGTCDLHAKENGESISDKTGRCGGGGLERALSIKKKHSPNA